MPVVVLRFDVSLLAVRPSKAYSPLLTGAVQLALVSSIM
jgi:predicted solute-binding protein